MITSDSEQSSALQGLDLTPLIDIIFIVLVFLLLTANTQLLSLPVDVPTEADSSLNALTHDKHVVINILTADPHWAINGTTYQNFDEFEAEFINIFSVDPDVKVVVAADKNAPVQPLMNVLALLQRQQISNTQILMEP